MMFVLSNIKKFIVKMLYYYLALLTWLSIIIMCLSIVLIPLYVYLKVETEWYDEPFYSAVELGKQYWWKETRNTLKKYNKRNGIEND